MRIAHTLVAALAGVLLAPPLLAPALAGDIANVTAPEEVGLSSERLDRLSTAFKAGVAP